MKTCDSCGEIAWSDLGGITCKHGVFCSTECALCEECPDFDTCNDTLLFGRKDKP